jgi:hypothetical protein
MTKPMTIECQINFHRRGYGGRKEIRQADPSPSPAPVPARIPRISRLMALAIRFEGLIESGVVTNYADLARFAYVSRARITQIMNLLLLAPDTRAAVALISHAMRGLEDADLLHGQRKVTDASPMATDEVVRILAARQRQTNRADLATPEKTRLTATLADALLRAIGVDVLDKRLESLEAVLGGRKDRSNEGRKSKAKKP